MGKVQIAYAAGNLMETHCMQGVCASWRVAPLCKLQCLVDLPLHQFHSPCNFRKELLGSSNASNC